MDHVSIAGRPDVATNQGPPSFLGDDGFSGRMEGGDCACSLAVSWWASHKTQVHTVRDSAC